MIKMLTILFLILSCSHKIALTTNTLPAFQNIQISSAQFMAPDAVGFSGVGGRRGISIHCVFTNGYSPQMDGVDTSFVSADMVHNKIVSDIANVKNIRCPVCMNTDIIQRKSSVSSFWVNISLPFPAAITPLPDFGHKAPECVRFFVLAISDNNSMPLEYATDGFPAYIDSIRYLKCADAGLVHFADTVFLDDFKVAFHNQDYTPLSSLRNPLKRNC